MMRLSIITTVFNSAFYLPKCLDSMLNQDILTSDYEIIIVNDGSPDNSEEIARKYAKRNDNIKIITQNNKGLAGARNTGIRAAKGKYICFVDPDDYVLENSLKEPLDRMETEALDVLRFAYTEVDENYNPTQSTRYPLHDNYSPKIMDGDTFLSERLGVACYVWSYFFRRSLILDNHIMFHEGSYLDDTPWLPQVLLKAKRVDSINIKRHFYLIRNNSMVRATDHTSIEKKISGLFLVIDMLKAERDENQKKKADRWFRMILAHCMIALLSIISLYRFQQRHYYLHIIHGLSLLPLSFVKSSTPAKIKIFIINLSPALFCQIIHRINP